MSIPTHLNTCAIYYIKMHPNIVITEFGHMISVVFYSKLKLPNQGIDYRVYKYSICQYT